MAIHFEPTAVNAVDFLSACQANLSFRPELKLALVHAAQKLSCMVIMEHP